MGQEIQVIKILEFKSRITFAFMNYPLELRKCLYSTNIIEFLNKEIKRRVKARIISAEKSLE